MTGQHQEYVTHAEFQQYSVQSSQRFDQLARSMESISATLDKIRDSRSTNWAQLIGIAGFISILVALYVSPLAQQANENDKSIREIQTNRNTSQDAQAMEQRLQTQITNTRDSHTQELIERAKWMGAIEERTRWFEKYIDEDTSAR